jgi:hypothetical protein
MQRQYQLGFSCREKISHHGRKRSNEKAPNSIVADDGLGGIALLDAESRC